MNTYTANVERSERYWAIHIVELDQWTQARNLREVAAMARDLISIVTAVPADSFDVTVVVEPPATVATHLNRARELIKESSAARSAAALESRQAALELHNGGIPLRDVGTLLGVSYQRAHQLVNEALAAS